MRPLKIDPRLIRSALVTASVSWALALPLAAYRAGQSDSAVSPSNVLALAAYQIGSLICHQRPERSFHLGLAPLPVCARCAGIYAGAAMAALIAVLAGIAVNRRSERRHRPWTAVQARIVFCAAAAPALLSLVYEWTTGLAPSNELRALTGVFLGAVVTWLLVRVE